MGTVIGSQLDIQHHMLLRLHLLEQHLDHQVGLWVERVAGTGLVSSVLGLLWGNGTSCWWVIGDGVRCDTWRRRSW